MNEFDKIKMLVDMWIKYLNKSNDHLADSLKWTQGEHKGYKPISDIREYLPRDCFCWRYAFGRSPAGMWNEDNCYIVKAIIKLFEQRIIHE